MRGSRKFCQWVSNFDNVFFFRVPEGGTLIFSNIRRLGSFLGGVQNFEFLSLLGFQRNKFEDIVDIFWGSFQNWTIFRGHFYAF